MSSKQEWLVILPDVPGKLEERLKVRGDHLNGIMPKVASGHIVFGGATLDEPVKEGEPVKMNGSALVAIGTHEEVMSIVKNDIYSKSGVWDAEKIQIFPFKSAIRKEL